jgi:hypothetical protein
MKTLILTLAIMLGGCSLATVNTYKTHKRKCTTHYVAPAVDTLLVVPPLFVLGVLPTAMAGCCGGGNGSPSATSGDIMPIALGAAAMAIVSGYSATHGYREVAECRERKGK